MKSVKELFEQVVPASAKVDSIDNQYLSPSSHDKRVRSRIFGAMKTFDGTKFQDITFQSGNNLSKDTSKSAHTTDAGNPEMPVVKEGVEQLDEISKEKLTNYVKRASSEHGMASFAARSTASKGNDPHGEYDYWTRKAKNRKQGISKAIDKLDKKAIKEDVDDVINVYIEESYDLTSEIFDLLDNTGAATPNVETLRFVASSLRAARDAMLHSMVRVDQTSDYSEEAISEEVELTENFTTGKLSLNDGTSVKLSAGDAKHLNRMLESTSAKKNMKADLLKSKKDFNSMLSFARDLKEDVLGEAVVITPLETILQQQLVKVHAKFTIKTFTGEGVRFVGESKKADFPDWLYDFFVANHVKFADNLFKIDTNAKGVHRFEINLPIGYAATRPRRGGLKRFVLGEVSQGKLTRYIDKAYRDAFDAEHKADLPRFTKRTKGLTTAYRAQARKDSINNLYKKLGIDLKEQDIKIASPAIDSNDSEKKTKDGVEVVKENSHIGGHPANYKTYSTPIKFNNTRAPVKGGTTAIITNDKRNIDGPLAEKKGDTVNVKFSRVEFYRMEVIEMLPNNKIKVRAFRR